MRVKGGITMKGWTHEKKGLETTGYETWVQ